MKWNSDQIITFLNIYEKYGVLWDIRRKDHMNKLKRDSAFEQLLKDLREIDGFENTDLATMKTKLKTIKTVYRQELNKISRSKHRGAGADDVYKPKLIWFVAADAFLNNVTITRVSSNNMSQSQQGTESESVLDDEEFVSQQPSKSTPTPSTSTSTLPSTTPLQTPKRRKKDQMPINAGIETAIHSLKQIVEKNEGENDEYDCFAKHVASQLRTLPIQSFILLQEEFQRSITRERLRHLASSQKSGQNKRQNCRNFQAESGPLLQ